MYRYIYAYEVDKMSQGRDNQVDCVLRMCSINTIAYIRSFLE